jgi:hypothetical protein
MSHHGKVDVHAHSGHHKHDVGVQYNHHGSNHDSSIGVNHQRDHKHKQTEIHGEISTHPTDNSAMKVHGSYNNHGGYEVGVETSFSW